MPKWEYKEYHCISGNVEWLNTLGKEGWECFSVTKSEGNWITYYLKREILE